MTVTADGTRLAGQPRAAAPPRQPLPLVKLLVVAGAVLMLALLLGSGSATVPPPPPHGLSPSPMPQSSDRHPIIPSQLRDGAFSTFTLNGVRCMLYRASDGGELYFWHPNATDPTVVEAVQPASIHPQIIVDVSGSMMHYGFLEPALNAAAHAAHEFWSAGEASKHTTQWVNVVQQPVLTQFSSAVESGGLDAAACGHDPHQASQCLMPAVAKMTRAHGGATQPELAFDIVKATVAQLPSTAAGHLVPIVMLTDGEFNGRDESQYRSYWRELADVFVAARARSNVRVSLQVVGLKHDSLHQIREMGRMFEAAGVPLGYITAEDVADIAPAFRRATRMTLSSRTSSIFMPDGRQLREAQVLRSLQSDVLRVPLAPASPADVTALASSDFFGDALAADPERRVAAVAAALDEVSVILANTADADARIRGVAGSPSDEDRAALAALAEDTRQLIVRASSRAMSVLEPFTVRTAKCSSFAGVPCADPDARMEVASPVVAMLRRTLADLEVMQASLASAAAARTDKRHYEDYNNVRNTHTRDDLLNATLEEVVEAAVEGVADTVATATSFVTCSLSAVRSKLHDTPAVPVPDTTDDEN